MREKEIPIVYILLEGGPFDFDLFVECFAKKWQLKFKPRREENSIGMIVDGMVVGCAFFPAPIADNQLRLCARGNAFWPEAESVAIKHSAHLRVALTGEKDIIPAHCLLSKVVHSLLNQRAAKGVYQFPALIEPSYYVKCAEDLVIKHLPTELWVHINTLNLSGDDNCSFYTTGMSGFGKKEFEIIETEKNFIDAYYYLKELIKHTIENDVNYKNGDTIGADDNQIKLSIAKGAHVKGQVIKIHM
jgi:hypothetical protein